MKLQLLLIAAAMSLQVFGAFIWDPSQIIKQRASDAVHAWHDQKGNDIMCALLSTDYGAGVQLRDTRVPPSAKSPHWGRRIDGFDWTTHIRSWYWFRGDTHPSACDFNLQGWAQAFDDLKPGLFKADWKCKRYVHRDPRSAVPLKDQKYRKNAGGTRYEMKATGAEYNHAFHQDGIILFQQSKTPITAAHLNWGRTVRQSAMPDLYHASEFLFADWKASFGRRLDTDVKRVQYCGNANVGNRITYGLLARYLVDKGQYDLEEWPAPNSRWSTKSPEGRALLATPAAWECVGFLMRHNQWLGIQYITNIRVFRGPPIPQRDGTFVRYPQFLFEIREAPQNLIKADPPAGFQPPTGPGPRPPLSYMPVQINPDFDIPGPSNPPPGPSTPQPGVPGPSTPRPGAPTHAQAVRQDMAPEISYKISYEQKANNLVRVHFFGKV